MKHRGHVDPVGYIRIVQRPEGEAPAWVRDAWIGVTLPLCRIQVQRLAGFGVLTGPRSYLGELWAIFRKRAPMVDGYVVPSRTAVETLGEANPDAAEWWRKNAPHVLKVEHHFVFDAPACERVGAGLGR